ncbi:MAG TPA: hypothetical protein VH643_26770 [Gemmataceae bacterium]|jgi:uncharacterized membrane protein YgcG
MRNDKLKWMIVVVGTLIAPCVLAGPAAADFLPSDVPTVVNEFQTFLTDFPQWDTAHLNLPLIALALTPEQQRAEMLLMLWDMWMHDHLPTPQVETKIIWMVGGGPGTGTGTGTGAGSGSGGGTISSTGGGGGGSPKSAPEPSSLALIACGSLGLLGYRLVQARRVRSA